LVRRLRTIVRDSAARHHDVMALKTPKDAQVGHRPERRFILRLPDPPDNELAMAKTLDIQAPQHLYLPKILERDGLAGFEPDALACFLALDQFAGPGVVLDVGANVGIYSWLASARTRREVHAFEPTPELVSAARRVALDNGLSFVVEELALGCETRRMPLFLSGTTDTSNSLAAGFRPSSGVLQVEVETLDNWTRRTGLVPAVVKVDTETTEPAVLRGAMATIGEHRPWILCEVLKGRVEPALSAVMRELDYHLWFHVTDQVPFRESQVLAGDPTYRHLMWMFAPERPTAEFWQLLRYWRAALAECTPIA
jgi:FkbM family methyltransferase